MDNKNLLQRGDVILLKKGMKVHTPIKEKFINPDKRLSDVVIKDALITIGESLTAKKFCDTKLKENLSELLEAYEIYEKDKEIKDFITSLDIQISEECLDASIFEGEYMVDFAGFIDSGYRVYCKKSNNKSIEVNFYQIGPYFALNKEVEIISRRKIS